MKVEVTRSGGVAGIARTGAVHFAMRGAREQSDDEWAALYRQARSERERLPVAESAGGSGPRGGEGPASHVRDAFQWTLRLGRERIEVPDSNLAGALRELAERVLAEGQ
ncbi:hypothetical protein GCM10027449_02550 [Sinomonas notoginsengisoli]|uniref:protealysin inhibitor emfourin n=1 Tax=Sinomonas notoginsengisoli TaxID=1457311 RepID=UPI001F3D2CA8|nr:protealysin inhibitor emfourin [Sinomonas notoginsengisoli]